MALKPLFKHPIGALMDCSGEAVEDSENSSHELVCELCGTKYLAIENTGEDSEIYFQFLGYKGVLHCCGKLIDILYQQLGKDFFERTLAEFMKDPYANDNTSTRVKIQEAFTLLQKKSKTQQSHNLKGTTGHDLQNTERGEIMELRESDQLKHIY